MKMKEVCARTGLTRRTILFYEEKGLFSPSRTRSNGRDYRDYSEEDVELLQEIAALRRAWFTIDEIRRMEEDPEEVGEIFAAYRQWLLAQQAELNGLIQAASKIDPHALENRSQLTRQLQREAEKLPLPSLDIQPRFKYLDALEEGPRHVEYQTNLDEYGDIRKPFKKQVQIQLGAYRIDDVRRDLGLEEYRQEVENGSVAYLIDRDPLRLKIGKGILTAIVVVFGYLSFFYSNSQKLDEPPTWPFVLVFLAASALRLFLAFHSWRRERRRLARYEAEKKKPKLK